LLKMWQPLFHSIIAANHIVQRGYLLTDSDRQTVTCLIASFPGQPRWSSTRKVKPVWILMK